LIEIRYKFAVNRAFLGILKNVTLYELRVYARNKANAINFLSIHVLAFHTRTAFLVMLDDVLGNSRTFLISPCHLNREKIKAEIFCER
jgi:hypothetical protein